MSVYPPPSRYPSIFNPSLFTSYSTGNLTTAQADATYAKLAGGQTIVAQETFSGGIKTNAIDLKSGSQLTVTAAASQFNGDLSCTGAISSDTSLSATTTQTYTLNVTGSASIPDLTIANSASIPTLTLGACQIQGTAWFTSALSSGNYTLTISTTSGLTVLGQSNFQGQLYIFAKNGSTNSGWINVFLVRRNGGAIAMTATSSPPTNFTTFTAAVANTNTITVSTGTTASQISGLFIGAY